MAQYPQMPTAPAPDPPPEYTPQMAPQDEIPENTTVEAVDDGIARCGYLRRRKNILFVKYWKVRWCILFKNGSFVVFEDEACTKPDLHMWLQQNCTGVRSGLGIVGIPPPEGFAPDSLLHVSTIDEGDLYFAADSLDEARAWEFAIKEARTVELPKAEIYTQQQQVGMRNAQGAVVFMAPPPLPIIIGGGGYRRWGGGWGRPLWAPGPPRHHPHFGPHHHRGGMHHHHRGGLHGGFGHRGGGFGHRGGGFGHRGGGRHGGGHHH